MRLLGLLMASLAVSCTMNNPAFELEGTDTGDNGASGDGGADDGAGGDDGGDDDGGGTGGDGGGDSTGTSSDDGGGGDDGGTTGGDGGTSGDAGHVCPTFTEGFRPNVDVRFANGAPLDGCNGNVDIQGPATQLSENRFEVKGCGGPEPCNPDCPGETLTFEITVPPGVDYLTPEVPSCAHVVVDYESRDPNSGTCPFSTSAVWDIEYGYDPIPYYMVGARGAHEHSYVEPFQIEYKLAEQCDCDSPDPGCCYKPPGEYKIKFAGLDGEPSLYADESSEATYTDIDYVVNFDIMNYQSHVHPECGVAPDLDWVVKRWPGG